MHHFLTMSRTLYILFVTSVLGIIRPVTCTDFRKCTSNRSNYPSPKSLTIANCAATPCRFDDGILDFTVEFVPKEEIRSFHYLIVVTKNFPNPVFNLPEACVTGVCPLKPNEIVRNQFRRYVEKVKHNQGYNQTVEISIRDVMCFEFDAII